MASLIDINNIDKQLVTEGVLNFTRGDDITSFNLTDDGIIEKYNNKKLENSFTFSKLGLIRECKCLIDTGYSLETKTEADIPQEHKEVDLSNSEQMKQELQSQIDTVDELQDLKDELDDKLDALNEEKTITEFPSTESTSKKLSKTEIKYLYFDKVLNEDQKQWIKETFNGMLYELEDGMRNFVSLLPGDLDEPILSIDEYLKKMKETYGGTIQ